MPPPCCMVSAASRRWAKIPPISSGIVPITKQLNKVTERPLPAPVTTDSLYDEDFYAWTQQQAEALRRLPTLGNELDLEHIAEEIEDLGRSDLRAARSLCQHIIEHLLKLEYSGLEEPAEHWRDEIVEWRLQLEQILTRSIEAKLDLPGRYRAALRLV